MKARIRISTSPPNEHEPSEGDASYYCDLAEIERYESFALVAAQVEGLKAILKKRGSAAYLVYDASMYGSHDKEIGIVVGYEDDRDGLMYCGIDHSGRVRNEPAVNEALWHVANAAAGLPDGHRLRRGPEGA